MRLPGCASIIWVAAIWALSNAPESPLDRLTCRTSPPPATMGSHSSTNSPTLTCDVVGVAPALIWA